MSISILLSDHTYQLTFFILIQNYINSLEVVIVGTSSNHPSFFLKRKNRLLLTGVVQKYIKLKMK
jgi:hypothetical protein